jgi:hypothetical protein
MKKDFAAKNITTTEDTIGLQVMVGRITAGTVSAASRKHSFVVNDVPSDILVGTDEHMLAAVFGSLLNTVISHTDNCCIRISAKLYGNVVLVNLKESYAVSGHAFTGSIRQVQQLAERIGGAVSICNEKTRETSIILSFANNLPLAA